MKILRVINSLDIGGAERSITGNVPLHIENGFDMEILLLNGKETHFVKELKQNNIRVHDLGKSTNIYNPFIIFKVCRIINSYDIIHVHLFPSIYWVGIAKMISRSKTKLVFTEHDTHNRRRNNWLLRITDRIIYRQYDSIITISTAAQSNLIEHIGSSYNFIKIFNGVDIKKVKNECTILKKDLQLKYADKKIITQVAGFRLQKDQDTLIKAIALLPSKFCAFLIGEGERKKECEMLAQKLGVSDRVIFLGIQDNIGSILGLSDIVVMSSHWEGFGRAAVEGMAAGKPLIASNVPGLSEVVEGAGLLFEVGDVEKIVELVLKLSTDQVYYNLIAQQCVSRAEKFDISKMIAGYEKVYNSLINKMN